MCMKTGREKLNIYKTRQVYFVVIWKNKRKAKVFMKNIEFLFSQQIFISIIKQEKWDRFDLGLILNSDLKL